MGRTKIPGKTSELKKRKIHTCEDAAKDSSVKYMMASGGQERELARNQTGKTVG